MKQLTWIMAIVFLAGAVSVILAQGNITMDIIKIDTPGKKSGGNETETIFPHKKHAEEYAQGCDKCHPALKEVVNAPENDKTTVHNVCKTCHDKDKPAKTFKCDTCHVEKAGA
ncbi:cytochrome c3 family protein [bacterium]|nr:cytochrome c3 family protein [candidate division CSSED10-310 bacterium]